MLRFDDAPKRATNLSLNAKVLDAAKELGMNISATVDELLAAEVRRRYWERWNEDNREAIADYKVAMAIDPSNSIARDNLAILQRNPGAAKSDTGQCNVEERNRQAALARCSRICSGDP